MHNEQIKLALREQVECYRRLAKLAEAQHEFVETGQTEELLEVLVRRQGELDRIGELEQVIAPAKREWSTFVASLDGGEREMAEAMVAQTRRLLEEITAADRNDAMVLQQRKISLGRQIGQASAARKVNRNYAAAAYGARERGTDIRAS